MANNWQIDRRRSGKNKVQRRGCRAAKVARRVLFKGADFENSIRLAISLGGDSDTQACIAGSIAGAFYGGIPEEIAAFVRSKLPAGMLVVVDKFDRRF